MQRPLEQLKRNAVIRVCVVGMHDAKSFLALLDAATSYTWEVSRIVGGQFVQVRVPTSLAVVEAVPEYWDESGLLARMLLEGEGEVTMKLAQEHGVFDDRKIVEALLRSGASFEEAIVQKLITSCPNELFVQLAREHLLGLLYMPCREALLDSPLHRHLLEGVFKQCAMYGEPDDEPDEGEAYSFAERLREEELLSLAGFFASSTVRPSFHCAVAVAERLVETNIEELWEQFSRESMIHPTWANACVDEMCDIIRMEPESWWRRVEELLVPGTDPQVIRALISGLCVSDLWKRIFDEKKDDFRFLCASAALAHMSEATRLPESMSAFEKARLLEAARSFAQRHPVLENAIGVLWPETSSHEF